MTTGIGGGLDVGKVQDGAIEKAKKGPKVDTGEFLKHLQIQKAKVDGAHSHKGVIAEVGGAHVVSAAEAMETKGKMSNDDENSVVYPSKKLINDGNSINDSRPKINKGMFDTLSKKD